MPNIPKVFDLELIGNNKPFCNIMNVCVRAIFYIFLFFFLQAKLDKSSMKPSRVVHLRNIPNEVTEAEIIHLGIPFGRVTNVLVLKGKNQVIYWTL